MTEWTDRILKEFTPDLCRLWIVSDPDNVLLDEPILSGLRERGFDLLPFEDSVVFRAEFEDRYRAAWDMGQAGPAKSLILHLRSTNIGDLPWDYLTHARKVSLSLANLFPQLSYVVVRQIGNEHLERLFDIQAKHVSQPLGEGLTKDLVLTHIFQISPHLISSSADFWRDLLRLQNRGVVLPPILVGRVVQVLADNPALQGLPIRELLSSKSTMVRAIQDAWLKYLTDLGVECPGRITATDAEHSSNFAVPFTHPDVRVIIESMFLDGTLYPEVVQGLPANFPNWAKTGIARDPDGQKTLVLHGIHGLMATLPTRASSHRDWTHLGMRMGDLIARFNLLDTIRADSIREDLQQLQTAANENLHEWAIDHYADLPSLPVTKGPVMVHHVPRFVSIQRDSGEAKIALLVFDGMALDQWAHIREFLAIHTSKFAFDESACFAWLPTLTSVSRQALFSGLKPREFAQSIETTSAEPGHWTRFWQDQGVKASEILYRKGIGRCDQLDDLEAVLDCNIIKVAGIVVDTVDELVHGAILGKRGIATQIISWCESGFVAKLFASLLDRGFHVYVTADHGNVEAVGTGRPNQGVASELNGERVRIYGNETLAANLCASNPRAFRLNIPGLPANYLPVFATGRTAFVQTGERIVAHGGMSVEELIVPFIKVSLVSGTK